MKTVAIIGPNGQLGTDLVKTFTSRGWEVLNLRHSEIEITNIDSVNQTLKSLRFDWVINTAAFHKVDECERDTALAWQVNALGQKNVAEIANEIGARSVFISSDYVFSGEKGSPYFPSDPVSPINAYGHTKAAGELSALSVSSQNLVMRISSVFGSAGSSGKGGNFVETIIKKAKSGDELKVVGDIKMSPTYTVDAATLLENAISNDYTGIFHGSNSGVASWFEFAKKILELTNLQTKLIEVETDWNSALKRPRYSALANTGSSSIPIESEPWEVALKKYLLEKGHLV